MPVTCPKCERPVASLRQWHYCRKVDIDSLFERKADVVVQLFDRLIETVGTWPGVAFGATKACIVFVADKTFLIAKPMKSALDLHFSLQEAVEDDAVYKCIKYKAHYVPYIRLHEEYDLTPRVIRLLRKAYEA